MKNKIITAFLWIAVFASAIGTINIDTLSPETGVSSSDSEISVCRDIVVWKYRLIKGQIYKRRYNVTRDAWIGFWKPA